MRYRLVHQKHFGLPDDGPANGYSLLLSAAQLTGITVQKTFDLQYCGSPPHLLIDFRTRGLPYPQRVGHILEDCLVGVESIGLKDHRNVSFGRMDIVYYHAADGYLTARYVLQACDHPQG